MDIFETLEFASSLLHAGFLDEALNKCQEALLKGKTLPNKEYLNYRSKVYLVLGDIYQQKGLLNETITAYYNALQNDGENQEAWVKFGNALKFSEFNVYNEQLKNAVLLGLKRKGISHQNFSTAGTSLLKLSADFKNINILENELLIALLEKTIIADPFLESFLTSTRHRLLDQFVETGDIPNPYKRFLEALSKQCFMNEYIYFETAEETEKIKKIGPGFLFNCYREKKEDLIHEEIPTLKPISDDISKKVQQQYEENPYPRYDTVDDKAPKSIQEILQETFPTQEIKGAFNSQPKILIAGSGTGQHAINSAKTYKNSDVLAVDLSRASLNYAMRKAKEFQISNIHFMQADILDLKELHQSFDLIECSGVLHHMKSPLDGWRVLNEILKSPGIMIISLYSELARQNVVAARALIEENHYQPTLQGIRACRQHILRLPEGDPIKKLSLGLDFYTASSCRDLLFHVQEHRFTIPQLIKIIKELDLEFLGFEIKNGEILRKYHSQFTEDPNRLSLENWHQFELENPDTFIGMYHLWLKKN